MTKIHTTIEVTHESEVDLISELNQLIKSILNDSISDMELMDGTFKSGDGTFVSVDFSNEEPVPAPPEPKPTKSKVVERVEQAGYHIEKTSGWYRIWHKDDPNTISTYARLRDIPCFPPYAY